MGRGGQHHLEWMRASRELVGGVATQLSSSGGREKGPRLEGDNESKHQRQARDGSHRSPATVSVIVVGGRHPAQHEPGVAATSDESDKDDCKATFDEDQGGSSKPVEDGGSVRASEASA